MTEMNFGFVLLLLLVIENVYADEGVNFAFGKPTWQSSTNDGGVSSRAVDGYKHPDYSQSSCMQTKTQHEPWWVVDLEQEIFVTSVRITNRADCCWENLINFNIRVGTSLTDGGKFNPQCGSTYIYNVGAGQTISVTCMPPVSGQYVSVSITDRSGTLNFCEVEVYGYQRHNVFSVKAISYGSKDVPLGKVSRLIVDDNYNMRLSPRGHHVISFNITTGQRIAHTRFDTQEDSSALTRMPQYLQNLPSEIFVFVILQNGGWRYYHTSIPILRELSGAPHISDQLQWGDAWSLLGYKGKLPSPSWTTSVMKNLGYTPAVIEDVIPKLLVPPHPPSSVIIVDLTSSSFTLRWSRPRKIVNENELPLEYIICVKESGTTIENCRNNGNIQLLTYTDLNPQTGYDVTIKAQSYAGLGPEAAVRVTTLDTDKYEIYVELVSRVKPDTLYRLNALSYSSITIRGQQYKFSQAGHHFIVLNPKTGSQIERESFNTNQDPSSSTKMAEFISNIPKPSIILMVVYYQAHNYYTGNSLRSVCPNAPLNYTSVESWSMTCLYGFGTMSWVTSLTSNGNKGPAIIKTHILQPRELKNAPVLQSVVPASSRSFQIRWTVPDTDEYTGKISYYQICYKKSNIDNNANCTVQSVASNLTQTIISGLHPFQEYSVKIRGVVAPGYGPFSNALTSTTPEAEPSSGPSTINFPRVSISSIFVTWSMPEEQNRNGIIRQYSVCYHSVQDTDPCDDETITDNNWFELNGLKPYQKITFKIKAATTVGFGPATIASQRTLPSVPDGPPTEARVTQIESKNMSIEWQPPVPELRNGKIINYTFCIRVFSTSPGPCLHEITLGNQTHYKATQLKPYTKYIINILAGTEIGFGPPVMIVNTTSEAEPSGPPKDLQVTDFTPYRMNFTWSPPDMSDMNGVLTKYSVCIKSQHSNFSLPGLHRFIVPSTQTSYMLSDLKPYVNYSLEVRAATVAGFGPQAKIFQRTAQSEPTGPPTKKTVTFVNESVISFSWSPPEQELRNGVIIHYNICIRKYGPESTCVRAAQISASDENSYTYSGLNPSKEYVVAIQAATVVGLGPSAFIQKTSGVCDLPVLHNVRNDRFSASGFLSRSYEPYQARIDNYLPWCESGNRKNAYIQVDFGGPLKILGVATKGHRQHWHSWVTSYKVSYSIDSINWKYANVSEKTIIDGNNGEGRQVQHFLDEPIRTRFVRFEVHTFVGLHPCMGIEVYGCAPAIKPKEASFITSSDWIRVTWNRLPHEVANGANIGYKICHKLSSSVMPCNNAIYLSNRARNVYVKDLLPFTDYTVEISAGTLAGYGPPFIVHAKTREATPSGPPHLLMAQDVTATSLNLVWSPPKENHRNGIITEYGVCYQEASLGTNCVEVVQVPMEQLSYRITSGLRPNTIFMFTVKAATGQGWGPRAVVYETTLPAAPSGPPTSVYAVRIGPRILQMFWQPPEAKEQNGDIIGYRVCIKEKSFTTPCRKYVTLPETQLMHTMDKLKPYTVYTMHVEAKTALGYGPAKYLDYQTGEAAPGAPPKDVGIRYVSSNSIEIMWAAPNKESRNGVIVLYEVIVYEEMPNSRVKKIRSSLMRANTTLWLVDDLSTQTDYIFHVKAATVEGFGPAVIIHKRSDGRIGQTGFFSEGKLTAGGIAGGSVMLAVLIFGIVLSILWNKGMLPHTRTRKLKLVSEEKQRRRRRRKRHQRRRQRRRMRNSEPAAAPKVHATDSVYSELNDYDAPRQKMQKSEDLYGIAGADIYSTGTTLPSHGIYAPVTTTVSEDIYGISVAAAMQDIYSSPQTEMNIYGTTQPDMNRNSLPLRTNLPPIVPRPSVLPPIVPLESTPSSIASNITSSTVIQQGTGNQITQSTASILAIPKPSKLSPIVSTPNAGVAINVHTTSSGTVPISHTPKPSGMQSFAKPSINHHPNMQSSSVTLSHDPKTINNISASSKLIPAPIVHQPSVPVPSFSKKK